MARPRSDIAARIVKAARRRFLEHGIDGASLRRIASDAGTSIGMVYYYFPTKDALFDAVVEATYSRLVADLATALAPISAPGRSATPSSVPGRSATPSPAPGRSATPSSMPGRSATPSPAPGRSATPSSMPGRSATPTFEERLRRMYARLAAMSEDEVTAVRIVVRELLLSSKRMDRIIDRVARGHLPLVLAAVMDGLASDQVSDRHDPVVITIAAMALGIAPQIGRRLIGPRAPAGFEPPSGEELARQLATVLLQGIAARRK